MIGLYEYDNATKEECYQDLNEILDWFDCYLIGKHDNEVLERKGIRIQEIAKRLKELEGEND